MSQREEVMAELIGIAKKLEAEGKWAPDHLVEMFPGLPESVAYRAWAAAESQNEDAWWESVERTIDAQVIRKAIIAVG